MVQNKKVPEFMILGAAKSGTTSLYAYLQRHPNIFLPKLKEPEFFSRDAVWNKGFNWYYKLFEPAHPDDLCGEASTTYSRWPHTLDSPKLIYENAGVKHFIYIMRHPVDRAFSHYQHHMRTGVTKTFEQALRDDDIYLDCSKYMVQIERYLQYFDRNNFLFLFSDDLRNRPETVLTEAQIFLGVDPVSLTRGGAVTKNSKKDGHYLRSKTTQRIRKIPGLSGIIDKFPASWREMVFDYIQKSSLGTKIEKQHYIPPMLPATRKKLMGFFVEPNKQLESFLQVDLSRWSD